MCYAYDVQKNLNSVAGDRPARRVALGRDINKLPTSYLGKSIVIRFATNCSFDLHTAYVVFLILRVN